MKRPRRSKPADPAGTSHALVGGWTQRSGMFLRLLLGIRDGRQRKLRFVGQVETPRDELAMTFLEGQLREREIESSPFTEDIPDSERATLHWAAPELVAEIDFAGWTKDRTLIRPTLKTVTERTAFRSLRWLKGPA